jgi:YD repeat-containing protein
VRDTTASTYSWDTTNLTQATNISGTNTYRLQFKWGTTTTAQTNSVKLTVTNSLGQQEIQTLSFWVPTGTSTVSGGGPTVTWPSTLPPDTVLPNGPQTDSQYVDAEANTGALETSIALPTYNANVAPVVLQYDSVAADPRPIVVVHHELSSSLTTPTKTSVQLTFNNVAGGTYYYATSAFNPGDYAQFAVQADATGLSTNRYAYSVQVIDYRTTNTTTTYSGTATVVNPADAPFGAIGQGWSISGLNRIISETGGVILDSGSNDRLWFATAGTSGGTTSYTSPAGDFTVLTKSVSGGTYTRTLPDGTKQEFDSNGYETDSVDRNGLRVTYVYDGSHKLTNINDPYGKGVTLAYDVSNKLATITDAAGRTATFAHSGNTLTGATMPDQSSWAYTYDGSGRLTQVTDPRAKVVSVAYDSANRVGTITRPDATTQTFTAYQERGYNTSGTSGSPAPAILLAEARASSTDPRAYTTDLRMDWRGLGLVEQMTDPALYVATSDRDANGLATISVDRLNRISLDKYDSNGNVLTHTYADGNTEAFTYNGFSEPLTDTDARGNTRSYSYDGHGNLTVTLDALNNRTTMTYTATGKVQTITDALNNKVTYQYDSQDRLTTITNPDGTTGKFAFDSKGNAVTVTDERGNSTTFAFDAMNREVGTTDALGNRVTNTFDSGGNLTQVQAPLSRTTNFAYDSMNR